MKKTCGRSGVAKGVTGKFMESDTGGADNKGLDSRQGSRPFATMVYVKKEAAPTIARTGQRMTGKMGTGGQQV